MARRSAMCECSRSQGRCGRRAIASGRWSRSAGDALRIAATSADGSCQVVVDDDGVEVGRPAPPRPRPRRAGARAASGRRRCPGRRAAPAAPRGTAAARRPARRRGTARRTARAPWTSISSSTSSPGGEVLARPAPGACPSGRRRPRTTRGSRRRRGAPRTRLAVEEPVVDAVDLARARRRGSSPTPSTTASGPARAAAGRSCPCRRPRAGEDEQDARGRTIRRCGRLLREAARAAPRAGCARGRAGAGSR